MNIDENWVVFYIFNIFKVPDLKETAEMTVRTMRAIYSNAGSPSGVWVYHEKNHDGDYVYYLSPAASVLYKEILDRFGTIKVRRPISLTNLALVIPDEPVKHPGMHWNPQPA
jgi:hypothetical protein